MSPRLRVLSLWLLALAAFAGFCALGTWQWRRSDEKRDLLERAAHALRARVAQPPAVAWDRGRTRDYDWTELRGDFAEGPPLLLDNQMREGKAGVRVYRLFHPRPAGGELLIEMGWLSLDGRRELPAPERLAVPPRPEGGFALRGLLAPPPSSGLALGAALSGTASDTRVLMVRFDLAAIDTAIGDPKLAMAPRVLKLDPALPFGYARDLDVMPNTLPPERHLGYAVQWFALALTVLITATVLSLRKSRSAKPRLPKTSAHPSSRPPEASPGPNP